MYETAYNEKSLATDVIFVKDVIKDMIDSIHLKKILDSSRFIMVRAGLVSPALKKHHSIIEA